MDYGLVSILSKESPRFLWTQRAPEEFYLDAEKYFYLPSTRLRLLVNEDGAKTQQDIFRVKPFTDDERTFHKRTGPLEEIVVDAVLTIQQDGQSSMPGINVLDNLTGYFVDGHYVYGFSDKSIASDVSDESRRVIESSYPPKDLVSANQFIKEAAKLLKDPLSIMSEFFYRRRLKDFIRHSNLEDKHKNAVGALLE